MVHNTSFLFLLTIIINNIFNERITKKLVDNCFNCATKLNFFLDKNMVSEQSEKCGNPTKQMSFQNCLFQFSNRPCMKGDDSKPGNKEGGIMP